MFFLFQSFSDAAKLLSIESVSVVGLMLFAIAYFIWQNSLLKKDLKEKEAKIDQIIAEHYKDLKDNTKDAVAMANRYHTFVEQLSTLTRHGHGRSN